jgi:hypothetical protein
VLVVVSLAFASDWRHVRGLLAARTQMGESDTVSRYERRYTELRTLLPRRGVVGYLSDRMDAREQYYLTQYALVPVVVDRSPDHPTVVGNFFEPGLGPSLARQHGLIVVRDFGKGLLLLRRGAE